ncbi:MAG: TRAP transporter small permease [Pseudomonadota bacterium]
MKDDELAEGSVSAIAHRVQEWLLPVFRGLAVLAAIAGSAIVLFIAISVTMRHVARAPLHVTEELVGLLMISAFFLALPLATLKAEHVRVSILIANLPHTMRRRVGFVAGLFGFIFCIWYVALCLPWLEFAFDRNLKTEVARLLMYPWMALIPFSMILTSMAFILRGLIGPQRS